MHDDNGNDDDVEEDERKRRIVMKTILPYFGKRKQVTKAPILVKEQNVSVISTDVNDALPCISVIRMSVYA